MLSRISIFCGANAGYNKEFISLATKLGETLADKKIDVIYGGAKVGLMGAVADGALNRGGKVIGVIPHFLSGKEIVHENLSELIYVDTMHERKMKMNDLSDGVIALPGGFGTMDEIFEMLTWAQLGLHKKPIGLLNWNRFYDSLIHQVQVMVNEGFLKKINQDMLLISDDLDDILDRMNEYIAPEVPKWLDSENI